MKHLRPQQPQLIMKKGKNEGDSTIEGTKGSQKGKKDPLLFEKNVVKPIRGGILMFIHLTKLIKAEET